MRKGGRVCAQIPFMQAQEVVIASRGWSFRPLGGALRAWHQHGMYDFEREAGGVDHISASDDRGDTVASLAATDNDAVRI